MTPLLERPAAEGARRREGVLPQACLRVAVWNTEESPSSGNACVQKQIQKEPKQHRRT